MKRLFVLFIVCLCFVAYAEMDFEKEASGTPQLLQKGVRKDWCPVCGMSIKLYYKTSHAVLLKNGKAKQYCSMHCLASDFNNIKDDIKEILAVDAKTEKIINAGKAYYLVGSSVDGTMSSVSKLAFAKLSDAKQFQKELGGDIMTFGDAFAMARASLEKENENISLKRQKVVYPIGAKIFKSACNTFDPGNYEQINDLKGYIKSSNVCGSLTEQQIQAVALYVWDVYKTSKDNGFVKINVPEDAKCPVCGMFVSKYPRWAAQINYADKSGEKTILFDGVKDMMKFYQNPAKYGYKDIKITDVLVTDYYSQKAVSGKTAFFVYGSEVMGPMGRELIPFTSEDNAKIFMNDHGGKKIVDFKQIKAVMLK